LRRLILGLCAALGLAAASAQGAPATPDAWRAATDQDLAAIHDLLRDNSPAMVVDRDSAHFRAWLEDGLREGRGRLSQVRDARGYGFALRAYVVGFRDSHIQTWLTDEVGVDLRKPVAWPGFIIGLRADGYRVAYVEPDVSGPPPGARLVSCDHVPAQAMASARDRFDGDLSLASGRFYAASRLLLDRGNPFLPRPVSCVFEAGGATRTVRLDWRAPDPAQLKLAMAAATGAGERNLDLFAWGPRDWWISIPDMGDDHDWRGFYAKVQANLPAIRSVDHLIIDLRGNGGGSSGYGDRLARMLWGEAFVEAREPHLGPTVWRATATNRAYWADLVARLARQPDYADLPELKRVLAGYDRALAAGQPTFRMDDGPPAVATPAGGNPMRARVVLLTDPACNSACLDLMDLFTVMPDVVQAGSETSADTIFMELTTLEKISSGLSGLAFGHKAWVERPRGSNRPYAPSAALTWRGDPADEAALRAWLRRTLEHR
jgi:hypothetical protein